MSRVRNENPSRKCPFWEESKSSVIVIVVG
uniref:Uncharacterized protein n=1 Tax=Rhizophora mucronata TaxID=61149 RepID=A0A2P2R105_RHIMU